MLGIRKLYLNPDTKVWVKVEIVYTLFDDQTVMRLCISNNNWTEIILSAAESNKLIDFDKSIVGTSAGTTDKTKSKTDKTKTVYLH